MSHQDEPQPGPEHSHEEEEEGFPSVDAIIGTFMSEPALMPVLIVMLGAAGAFGGAMLVLAGVDRNPFAAAALFLLFGMTADVVIRSRRNLGLRNLARLVGLIWLVAAGFAGIALWTGIAF